MKQEQIREGNKLIADFMNIKSYQFNSLGAANYMVYELEAGDIVRYTDADWKLKYHTSWDWIMVVVEKIEASDGYKDFQISGKECLVWNMEKLEPIVHATAETKIKAVWLACVAFIKWYNEITAA